MGSGSLSTRLGITWLWPAGALGAIPAAMATILNTLVVIALAGTLAVLFAGVFTMARGGEFNRKWGNKLMRARVATQGLAILLLLAQFLLNRDWGG